MSHCDAGWDVTGDPTDPTCFCFGARIGPPQDTFIYRVGSAPDDRTCRTIWCYGDSGVPWTRRACRQPVVTPPCPLSAFAKLRHERGEDHAGRAGRPGRFHASVAPGR